MSEHNHDCNCGGDCNCNDDELTVTLTLDNDEEVECAVITIYTVKEQQYIALLPLDEEGENDEGDVFIYRFQESEDGEPTLDNIDDDDEYELAADAFDEWLDTQEFEELDDEE
ncbi:MAG: DUF1292 domain-containing protein [Lachnospiraceae bacterium]